MRKLLPVLLAFFPCCLFAQDLPAYIATHAREIKADAPEFKGLGFLDTLLANKRIVLLGESSHGTEEYSETKLQLIEYLHTKLGFNVVLFESPMIPGSFFNMAGSTVSSDSLVRNSIQSVWHTRTVSRLFRYLEENNMRFGGFDPQFMSSSFSIPFYRMALANQPAVLQELIDLEQVIDNTFTKGINERFKDSISMAYRQLEERMSLIPLTPLQQWVKQTVHINSRYYKHLYKGNERDSCMAQNLIWLAEKMYPNEKIIVWAHNTHIDKNSDKPARFMGKLAAQHFGSSLYSIGLYMVNGTTALNDRTIIPVKKSANNSLEGLLLQQRMKIAFISTNHTAFDTSIKTLHWGKDMQKLNVSKSYDAVILVNGVHAPMYLNK